MTRWPIFVLILSSLIVVSWFGGKRSANAAQPTPVDSSKIAILHDTIRIIDSVERKHLSDKRKRIKTAPIAEVIDSLPTDPVDTLPPALVPDGTIRATADSLATCRHDRDSLTRDGTLWKARTAAQEDARRLCEAKPVPVQPEPPSRALWVSVGASAAFLSILSVFILSR